MKLDIEEWANRPVQTPTEQAIEPQPLQTDTPAKAMQTLLSKHCLMGSHHPELRGFACACLAIAIPESECLAFLQANTHVIASESSYYQNPAQLEELVGDIYKRYADSFGKYQREPHQKKTLAGLAGSPDYESTEKESTENEWGNPDEITAPLASVMPLSPDMLPESFRDYSTDVADRMRCPLDFVAVSSIIMASTLIGTRCGIRPKAKDDWLVIPNLWGGVVAPPSSLKTPSLAEPLRMLGRLITTAKDEHEQSMKEYQIANIDYEATLKVFKAQREAEIGGKAVKGAGVTLPEKPNLPTERRYQTNDTTVEKLGELLNENPNGLMVFRDELTGLLASWERSGHEQDRAFYLEAWNGNGSQTVDRIGRGKIHVENCCVSLLGGIQPTKLLSYLQNAVSAENDGFVQRLQLLVYPDPEPWQLVDRYPNAEAKSRMWDTIQQLDQMDLSSLASKDEFEKFPYLHFDQDGQIVFYDWLRKLELDKLRNTEEHPLILEHLSKYRSLMPSLALIFHLIDYAESKTFSAKVSESAAKMAVKWCNYLETHARRIYRMATHTTQESAKELAKKIQAGKVQDNFTAKDIYDKGWYLLNTAEHAKNALEWLGDANWVRIVSQPKTTG